ncbi:hypothetical protein, partial [Vibrio parahaemolyticus]|uniref:hypothetical protein n=1 Tax=Vibrio parahaemolyticus TaxID=670 RepID=UPI001C5CE437
STSNLRYGNRQNKKLRIGYQTLMKGLIKELAFVNKPPLDAYYVYYVKYDVTIRQILSALLSYLFQILNLS